MTRLPLEDEEQPARIPGWALTYIDLMWLLLLFFILRSAVSEISEGHRYREIAAALKKRFGVEAEASAAETKEETAKAKTVAKERKQYSEILREGLDETAAAQQRSLTFRGLIFFAEEENKLGSEQRQILQAIAQQVGQTSGTIEIRGGMTEISKEPKSADPSMIDPVFARCIATRDYLVKLGVERERLRIALSGAGWSAGEKPCVRLYSVTETTMAEIPDKTPVMR